MKLKICGMREPENIKALAALTPDYMGFIFWAPSSRFVEGTTPTLPQHIKKTGVFFVFEIFFAIFINLFKGQLFFLYLFP